MNKTVDPCDNFYEYMCGEWESKITIPSHLPSWGRLEMFQAATHERMKGNLNNKLINCSLFFIKIIQIMKINFFVKHFSRFTRNKS